MDLNGGVVVAVNVSLVEGAEDAVFTLVSPSSGYFAFGPSPDAKMPGSSVAVVEAPLSQSPSVRWYDLNGYSSGSVVQDTTPDIAQHLFLDSVESTDTGGVKITLHFVNSSVSASSSLRRFPYFGKHRFALAYSSSPSLRYHDGKRLFVLDLGPGPGNSTLQPSDDVAIVNKCLFDDETALLLKMVHGAIMLVAWSVLIPVGVFFARFVKRKDPLWFHLHRGMVLSGYALSLAASALALAATCHHFAVLVHTLFAIVVTLSGLVTIILGATRPGKKSPNRAKWRTAHRIFATTALLFAIANSATGFYMLGWFFNDGAWRIVAYVYIVWMIFVVGAFIAADLRQRRKRRAERTAKISARGV